MVKKLFDKSLLENNVVSNSVIFDSQVLVNENASILQNKLKWFLTHLMELQILTSVQCDKITEQFTNCTDSQLKLYAEKFHCFNSSTKDLDELYLNEKSFSVNNTVINVNVRRFHSSKEDYQYLMISNKVIPESVQITNKLFHSVSTAWQKYRDQSAENKQTKNQEYIKNQKRLLIGWNKRSYGKTWWIAEGMQIIRGRICSIRNPYWKRNYVLSN